MKFIEISTDQAREIFAGLVGNEKYDTAGGLGDFSDLLGGGRAYLIDEGGEHVGAFCICKVRYAHGIDLEVRAAWQLSKRGDLTERAMPLIEATWGYDCETITVYTKRAGLVKKLAKQGFNQSAVILKKKIEG